MIEVLRTNDLVRLTYALALLEDAGCRPVLLDQYISALEGGISAFPRRIVVPEAFEHIARQALEELDAAQPDPGVDPDDGDD